MRLFYIKFLLLIFPLVSCGQSGNKKPDNKVYIPILNIGYDLAAPDKVYKLPSNLTEISGITELDALTIACVQDEHETVYIFDINKNQTVRQIFTGYDGDYEGIARVNKTIYILRSDGVLTEISGYDTEKFRRTTFVTGIPWKNNEGLCYDQKNNRLLIAPKENPKKDSEHKDFRPIYSFNLTTKKLSPEPVFTIRLDEIKKFAMDNKIRVPMKNKKEGKDPEPDIRFQVSAIGIHPVNGRLFVISGPERILFAFDMKGKIVFMERLSSDLFKQPEGITFMKNGDMFISNEGKEKAPTLVRFNYKPAATVSGER